VNPTIAKAQSQKPNWNPNDRRRAHRDGSTLAYLYLQSVRMKRLDVQPGQRRARLGPDDQMGVDRRM
jgi:hypothetical protein